MENTTYITLSRELALQRKMDTIAGNIANMSTAGYKGQHMVFTEHVMNPKTATPGDKMSMVLDYGLFKDNSQGSASVTGNPFDVSIQGEGYFAVQTDAGTRYTRNGSFTLDNQRQIVMQDGKPVLDEGGNPIVVPEGTTKFNVDSQGRVATEQGEIGRFRVVTFENLQDLQYEGSSLVNTAQPPVPVAEVKVVQGTLENSNINPVKEMTDMIDVSRSYQMTMNILQSEHERERSAIQRLSRLS